MSLSKFKVGDVVYFQEPRMHPCQNHMKKGTIMGLKGNTFTFVYNDTNMYDSKELRICEWEPQYVCWVLVKTAMKYPKRGAT